jgi:hypothetical protein
MKAHSTLAMTGLLVGVVTCSVVQAQTKKVERSQLPPAVEKTVVTESRVRSRCEDGHEAFRVPGRPGR